MNLEETAYKGFTLGLITALTILTAGYLFSFISPSSDISTWLFHTGILVLVITPATVITILLTIFVKNREKYMAIIVLTVVAIIVASALLKTS